MIGRPRKPSALHVLSGTDRADRMNPAEPKPRPTTDPKPPRGLLARPRRVWREWAPVLTRVGVLTELDPIALTMLCQAFVDWQGLVLEIHELGRTYETKTPTGSVMVRPRPQVADAAIAFANLKGMLIEFGMTPASRSRITAVLPAAKDAFEEFLSRPARGSLDAILS